MSRHGLQSTNDTGLAQYADVALVVALVALGTLTLWIEPGAPVRIAAALVVLFVLPGYALTTAVFPAATTPSERPKLGERVSAPFQRTVTEPAAAALTDGERLALAVGLSMALLPVFGATIQVVVGSFQLVPIAALVVGFTLVALALGVLRRQRTAAEHRFTASVAGARGRLQSFLHDGDGRSPGMLNVALVVVIIASLGSFSFALVAPQQGAGYTELYLLSSSGDGDYEAMNYPDNASVTENDTLKAVVENHEHEPVEYTLVVSIQRLDVNGTVLERDTSTVEKRLEPGESWEFVHTVQAPFIGNDLQVAYYLYQGEPAEDLSQETAYRYVSFRTDIETT